MLRGQPPARVLLIDVGALGDADQRVMRLVDLGLGEIDVIGGDQRDALGIGHLDMPALADLLGLGQPVLARVALQLDVEPVAEGRSQPVHQHLGLAALSGAQQPAHRTIRPAGEADHVFRMLRQLLHRHMRHLPVAAQIEAGVELHQVLVAAFGLRQQHHRRGRDRPAAGRRGLVFQVDLAAHDRLHARPRQGDGGLEGAEHVVGVGHRDRWHLCLFAKAGKLLHRHGALQQRILGVGAQVDESGMLGHAATLCGRRPGLKWARPWSCPNFSPVLRARGSFGAPPRQIAIKLTVLTAGGESQYIAAWLTNSTHSSAPWPIPPAAR